MAGTVSFIDGDDGEGSIVEVSAVAVLPVDWVSSPATGKLNIANGGSVTQGSVADAAVTNPASSGSEIALLKGLLQLRAAGNVLMDQIVTNTADWVFSVSITPDPPPDGTVSLVYAGVATHFHRGKPPRVFTLQTGTLPLGLSLNSSTGAIGGTPLLAGSFSGLSIRCTDANAHTADTSPFTIVIAP